MEKKPLTLDELEQKIASGVNLEELLTQLDCSNVDEFKKMERKLVSNKKMTGVLKRLRENCKTVNCKTSCVKACLSDSSPFKTSENVISNVYSVYNPSTIKTDSGANAEIRSARTVETIDDDEYTIVDNINMDDNTLEKELEFYENYANTLSCEIAKVRSDATIQYKKLAEMKATLEEMLQEVKKSKKELDKCIESCMLLKASEQKYQEEQERIVAQIDAIKREITRRNQVYLVFSDSDVQNAELIGKKVLYEQEMKQISVSDFNKIFLEDICSKETDDIIGDFKMSSLKKMAYIIAICNKYEDIRIIANNDTEIIELCKIMHVANFATL